MVYVKPHESTEETNKSTKDPNVDLVYRGIPAKEVALGYKREPEKDVRPVEVQAVVIFEMVGDSLDDAQKSFLDHLIREGVVLNYAWFDETGRRVGKSE
jgi:hypothetical protein